MIRESHISVVTYFEISTKTVELAVKNVRNSETSQLFEFVRQGPARPRRADARLQLRGGPAPPPRGGPRGLRRRARALGGRAGLSRPARKLAKLAEFKHSSSFSLSEIHVLIEFTF